MAEMLIKMQAEATGWHQNLRCEGPYLQDGWAVVPADLEAAVAQNGGVVTLTVGSAPAEDYPAAAPRPHGGGAGGGGPQPAGPAPPGHGLDPGAGRSPG